MPPLNAPQAIAAPPMSSPTENIKSDAVFLAKWPGAWEFHSTSTERAKSPSHFQALAEAIVRLAESQTFPVLVALGDVIPSGQTYDGKITTWSGGVRFTFPQT